MMTTGGIMVRKISILGSTGSIGTNTLNVIREHSDRFEVVALAAGTNMSLLAKQIEEFKPEVVSVENEQFAIELQGMISKKTEIVVGDEGLIEVATQPSAHMVVTAIVGSRGLRPTMEAIKSNKTIGLANKETLVSAGSIVTQLAHDFGVKLIPIDSEHSAIYQCLNGEQRAEVSSIWLTASGGSFRDRSREQLRNATIEDALKHPNWSMGAKITIDSATMMNKGLEVIEAHWLYNMPYDNIKVIIHPESIIHSLVEFQDGAVMAQLGTPDMRVPIQYALSYPNRLPLSGERLSLTQLQSLHFYEPDLNRFPSLRYAFESGKIGGTMPTVLNAANEVAVERFLQREITFLEIEECIERTMEKHAVVSNPDIDGIDEADRWARAFVKGIK